MQLSVNEKARLRNKYGDWAIITGATSGIGLELATRLAEAGLNLLINARSLSALKEVQSSLQLTYGVEIHIVDADLSYIAGVEKLIEGFSDLNVGLLVAAAGYGTSGLFINNSVENEVNMLRLNCEALLLLTHHLGQRFAVQKRGGIILMSSMVAFQGVPFAANYAATKAFVQTLAEGLAVELKSFGVDVLAAAPGPVDSGFGKRANMNMNMSLKPAEIGVPILRALGRKRTVLPGLLTKGLVYSLRTVPRWGKIKIMAKVMGGFTAHQRG